MKRQMFTLIALLGMSLWSIAHATTVTYSFNGSTQSVGNGGTAQGPGGADGMVFTTSPQSFNNSGAAPSITVYGESVPNGLVGGNPPDDGGPGIFGTNGSNGSMGLFEVTNGNDNNTASGIAPYVPGDNGQALPHLDLQDGVTEKNVLLINLSNLTAGSTVSFVMATGAYASANTGINVWTGTPTGTPLGIGTGWAGQTASNSLTTESIVAGNVDGACNSGFGQCSATQNFNLFTAGNPLPANEWIAIQADCHYLLLQSITINSPSGVPEPSFYGFLALAMVGLVYGARKMRARAAATAEKA